ncbi:NAD(P)/FAD-dependent oxidoreductase [Natronospira bacteriovora]|uniref:FAD/NAD(P)-binding oxidoreductase n=1 Tax=Natronospira bacteriovora TaxID=3069753 RepID=A0ABU0W4Y8_9GAMM|nr:FAD/NAD(P)-binding oxidoreductase [Natronospira sp. AB-CW4]MDQ2069079.1 FAD/NAD(P)-binding oxidoreductase [Natronospira sp. AB-CW4]
MAHTVIIGAGLAGMPLALELRKTLGRKEKITVVSPADHFQFVPSNPWIAVGWRERPKTTTPLAPPLKKRGIDLKVDSLAAIDPDAQTVTLRGGETLNYDYLAITTGPKLAFEEIPGLGPENGHSQSICTLDHSEHCRDKYEQLLAAPGPIVIGAAQGASCFGPAYEFAFILDRDLRKRGLRHQVPITFVTSEPYIGHLGLGGVGDSRGLLEHELRQRDIRWICNAKTDRLESGKVFVSEHDDQGEVRRQHEIDAVFSMILPAFKGVDPVAAIAELCNPRGFVKIDEFQRNPTWPNIYASGVCVAIPPVEQTPVATGAPKTGYMIESMNTAIAENIKLDLAGEQPEARATWNALCLADMGNTGAAFLAMPQMPPRNVTWTKKGKWVHWAKSAFEWYFLRKMRKGVAEPAYERAMLRMLGIRRLRAERRKEAA